MDGSVEAVLDALLAKVGALRGGSAPPPLEGLNSLSPTAREKLEKLWSALDGLQAKRSPLSPAGIKKVGRGEDGVVGPVEFFASVCSANSNGPVDPCRVVSMIEEKSTKGQLSVALDEGELNQSIMQSRVFVAFVSNEYAQDELCCSQFEYAKVVACPLPPPPPIYPATHHSHTSLLQQ